MYITLDPRDETPESDLSHAPDQGTRQADVNNIDDTEKTDKENCPKINISTTRGMTIHKTKDDETRTDDFANQSVTPKGKLPYVLIDASTVTNLSGVQLTEDKIRTNFLSLSQTYRLVSS